MIDVVYTPEFLRQLKKLPRGLIDEVEEKIELFRKDPANHSLKTHKLKGRMKGYCSFSVNYSYRIVFEYDNSTTAALLSVGDHTVYE